VTFPENDPEFKEETVERVEERSDGTSEIVIDGWHLWAGEESKTHKPKVGSIARCYGKGTGYNVRGLFIDGHRMWYRTQAEDREYQEISLYGADATEWLNRWDGGQSVWSIEMGGLGPGYEQCIQITAAEILRWYLANKPDLSQEDKWKEIRDEMDTAVSPTVRPLGLSGAQWGAAVNIATMIYRHGPRVVMTDERVKDRRIQVERAFPNLNIEATTVKKG